MSTSSDSGGVRVKALAAKYKWIGMIAIVVAILGYAIIMKTPLKEFTIDKESIKVSFAVKAIDQRPDLSIYSPASVRLGASKDSDAPNITIQPPGEDPIQVERIILVPGEDDSQNRHLELVRRALEIGEVDVKYQESDQFGEFSLWLTYSENDEGHRVLYYTTRLVRHDGTMDIAFREAYRQGETWLTQISSTVKEAFAAAGEFKGNIHDPIRLDQPRIRSLAEILQALENERYHLVRGQLDAQALLNLCFVKGRVTDEIIHQVELQGRSLAQEVGLTVELCYAIAEFSYGLYEEGEYLGSKVFWETMILLNPWDAYFFNMLGVSLEGLHRLESALRAYEKALELDPEEASARSNLQRLRARLRENG
jgi:hypothetical protein